MTHHSHTHDHSHSPKDSHNHSGSHDHCCACGHHHHHEHHHHHDGGAHRSVFSDFVPEIISLILLIVTVCIHWSNEWIELAMFLIAVLPVGLPILKSTLKEWAHGSFFNEFTLMVMASIGAFFLKEYAEGVAVLLFYSVGEKLEDVVSGDVKGQIKRLLGKMPKTVTVIKGGEREIVKPEKVTPGMTIAVKAGEAIPLDGKLLNVHEVEFNTAAITGESLPRVYNNGDTVSSGIIPVNQEVRIEVTSTYDNSSMSRIMKMIEDASSHRAPSETVLRRITRWYTPIVFVAALLLFVIPWIISLCSATFTFEWYVWLKRSLVFLVCSCPCALIVSIPLSYFASIGIASKKGILFKGHDSLDALGKVKTLLLDKTGTVTTGKFHVTNIASTSAMSPDELLAIASAIEAESPHPLADAIISEARRKGIKTPAATNIKVINHGMSGQINNKNLLVGSSKLMSDSGVDLPRTDNSTTAVYVSADGKLQGYIELEDTLKKDVEETVTELHDKGVESIGILSGDNESSVRKAQEAIGADFFKAALLPEDKQRFVSETRSSGTVTAFAGDGVNDGPALAAADVGIAMGSEGTDIAIESAQVVIANDDIEKISEGIDISRRVKYVIIENVTFAFGVKLAVMILGAFGIATLWAAVFADTGVTVITILWTLYRLKIWQLKANLRK